MTKKKKSVSKHQKKPSISSTDLTVFQLAYNSIALFDQRSPFHQEAWFTGGHNINKPAAQAAGAEPSQCNSTSRQNPSICGGGRDNSHTGMEIVTYRLNRSKGQLSEYKYFALYTFNIIKKHFQGFYQICKIFFAPCYVLKHLISLKSLNLSTSLQLQCYNGSNFSFCVKCSP